MKIISVHISAFGALHDHEETYEDGLNVCLHQNGWGKSTLAVFIKAMLFGLPIDNRTQSLAENEWKRYDPWDGGTYGGSMVIEVEGKQYRIERTFRDRQAAPAVTDLATGLPADVSWASNPGEKLFGINAAAYERSTYISQRQLNDRNAGMENVYAKLSHLVDDTDDLAQYDTALQILGDVATKYTPKKGVGLLAKLQKEVDETTQRVALCRVQAQKYNEAQQAHALTLQELAEQRASAAARQKDNEELHRSLAARAVDNHYRALLEEEKQIRDRLNSVQAIPTETEIEELGTLHREALRLQSEMKQNAVDDAERATLSTEKEALGACEGSIDAPSLLALTREWESAANHVADVQKSTAAEEEAGAISRLFSSDMPTEEDIRAAEEENRAIDKEKATLQERISALARTMENAGLQSKQCLFRRKTALICALCTATPTVLFAGLGFVNTFFYYLAAFCGVVTLSAVFLLILYTRRARANEAVIEQMESDRAAGEKQLEVLSGREERLYARLHLWGESYPDSAATAEEALRSVRERILRLSLCRTASLRETEKREEASAVLQTVTQKLLSAFKEAFPRAVLSPENAGEDARRLLENWYRLCQEESVMQDRAKRFSDCEKAVSELEARVQTILRPYPDAPGELSDAVLYLRERLNTVLRDRALLAEASQKCEDFKQENHPDDPAFQASLAFAQTANADAIEQAQKEAEMRVAETESRLIEESAELKRLAAGAQALEESEAALAAEEEELSKAAIRSKAVNHALKYLEAAHVELTARYTGKIRESFAAYLTSLTEGESFSFTMDTEYKATFSIQGVHRATENFNKARRDLIAVCERLALVDAMFDGETPILVLDDPFSDMDDATQVRMQALLQRLAQKYQIIYFTCSQSRTAPLQENRTER